jgi:excisionase family DNA binding protein
MKVRAESQRRDASSEQAFFTIAELANRWKVSDKSVRRLIKQQKLAAHLFGRLWRISEADALMFERANRIA